MCPSYGRSRCSSLGGGFVLGILNGLAVAKLDVLDQLAQSAGAVKLAPSALGRLGESKDHTECSVRGRQPLDSSVRRHTVAKGALYP